MANIAKIRPNSTIIPLQAKVPVRECTLDLNGKIFLKLLIFGKHVDEQSYNRALRIKNRK